MNKRDFEAIISAIDRALGEDTVRARKFRFGEKVIEIAVEMELPKKLVISTLAELISTFNEVDTDYEEEDDE